MKKGIDTKTPPAWEAVHLDPLALLEELGPVLRSTIRARGKLAFLVVRLALAHKTGPALVRLSDLAEMMGCASKTAGNALFELRGAGLIAGGPSSAGRWLVELQPRIGASQPRIGASQPRIGASQPRIGASQPQYGVEIPPTAGRGFLPFMVEDEPSETRPNAGTEETQPPGQTTPHALGAPLIKLNKKQETNINAREAQQTARAFVDAIPELKEAGLDLTRWVVALLVCGMPPGRLRFFLQAVNRKRSQGKLSNAAGYLRVILRNEATTLDVDLEQWTKDQKRPGRLSEC